MNVFRQKRELRVRLDGVPVVRFVRIVRARRFYGVVDGLSAMNTASVAALVSLIALDP